MSTFFPDHITTDFGSSGPALIWLLAQLVVMLWLAVAVKRDAEGRIHGKAGGGLRSPWLWFFVVLLTGGYLGALGYWLIHYSALRYRHDPNGYPLNAANPADGWLKSTSRQKP